MNNSINEIIGKNLSVMRKLRGYSQTTLGKALTPPVTYQQISKYEKGSNQIAASTILDLSKILGCSVTDLFAGIESEIKNLTLSKNTAQLIHNYEKLPGELQQSVVVLIRAMILYLADNMRVK